MAQSNPNFTNLPVIPSEITLEMLNEQFNKNMTAHLGIEYTDMGSHHLSGKMPVDDRTKQPLGLLHGGASVVLAESLGSLASALVVHPTGGQAVGQEINANHLRPVTSGWVYGTAKAVHLGRKTHIWDVRINNEEGKLVCISRLTVAVISPD